MPSTAGDIIRNYRTCEFTTLFRDGAPQTWPVGARLLEDGRFLLTTSIGLPQKAFNIRRNAKVIRSGEEMWNWVLGSNPIAKTIVGARVDDGVRHALDHVRDR